MVHSFLEKRATKVIYLQLFPNLHPINSANKMNFKGLNLFLLIRFLWVLLVILRRSFQLFIKIRSLFSYDSIFYKLI